MLFKGETDTQKVRVWFSLEDLDLSGFQDGTTYTQVKAYVLAHYGLNASTIYIAQVKRKCGLDVGESCNCPKPSGRPQPQVSPEKEEAIHDALIKSARVDGVSFCLSRKY